MNSAGVPLSAAIESLRAELQQAIEHGGDRTLRFAVQSIDLELQVALTTGGEASGTVGGLWRVLSFGVKADRKKATTHTLRLSLSPRQIREPDAEVMVGDRLDQPPA
ncbi:MAG: trypco2 family protein [Gammaproteobacteria bacterium]